MSFLDKKIEGAYETLTVRECLLGLCSVVFAVFGGLLAATIFFGIPVGGVVLVGHLAAEGYYILAFMAGGIAFSVTILMITALVWLIPDGCG